ncbi:MAG TPA: hypothetical protein VFN61_06185, partial [Acidimicrobiales bacterium]|nr:hypothetical protein [Acidimicrobiales bacterium]
RRPVWAVAAPSHLAGQSVGSPLGITLGPPDLLDDVPVAKQWRDRVIGVSSPRVRPGPARH